MTRSEYLEYVQEALAFPPEVPEELAVPFINPDPEPEPDGGQMLRASIWDNVLRDTPEVCAALAAAHNNYAKIVERILFPERKDDRENLEAWEWFVTIYPAARHIRTQQEQAAADHGFCA